MAKKDRKGWILPEVIDPETRKAVCICIPDELNHVMAFWGALRELGYWFNWQRNPAKDALPVSLVWAQIVNEAHAKWIEGVMCTSCEELIACLQPLMDEINAKLDSIQTGVDTLNYGAGNTQAGEPLSPEELAENQAGDSNPTCDLDILWAQCLALVQYTNQLIVDALEAAEAATNSVELMQVITAIPGLDEVGADAVAGYIALIQDAIAENYAGEYTEAKEQEIACAIFCACRDDCEITIERVNQVYHDLVAPFFGDLPSTFSTLAAFMSYFIDQNVGSDVVVYVLHYTIWAGGALANLFLGDIGTKSLQVLLQMAVSEADDDWMILCTECPDAYCHPFDFEDAEDRGWSPYNIGGLGFGADLTISGWEDIDNTSTGGNNRSVSIKLPMPGAVHVTRISFKASLTMGDYAVESEGAISIDTYIIATGVRTNRLFIPASEVTSGADQTFTVDVDLDLTAADGIGLFARSSRVFAGSPTGEVILTEATICGDGEDPFA
jgi:hypothetical protein